MQSLTVKPLFGALLMAMGTTCAAGVSTNLYAGDTAQQSPGTAQGTTKKADQPEKPATLATVVVTGSNLPVAPDEVVVPVVSVDNDAIKAAGVNANVLDLLRKVVPSFAGRSNTGTSNANNNNQNTAGGSQLQLRNLDTLVLVDGRRVATSGINGIGGKSFVDVNQIPISAIDHIEVLTDGASAIYGSDAIGGVVNIILKKDYQGAEVGVRYGAASGNYREKSGYFVAGTTLHGVHITVTGSESKTDPLYQDARSFTSPLYGRISNIPGTVGANGHLPGAILASGLNSPAQDNPTGTQAIAPSINSLIANGTYLATTPTAVADGFDVSRYQTLLERQDQKGLSANLSADLLDDHKLTAFGNVLYSRTKSFTQWLPVRTTTSLPAGAPYNPLTTAFNQIVFGYLPRPQQFVNQAEGLRVVAGLRGDINSNWNWESTIDHSQSKLEQDQFNLIYAPNMAAAVAGGYDAQGNPVAGGAYSRVQAGYSSSGPFVIQPALNPLAVTSGINPAMLANLYGTEVIHAKSTLDAFDAKLVGKAFHLPAGTIGVAFGVEARRESLSAYTDANGRNTGPTAHNWIGGTSADPFSRSRDVDSAYSEVRVPITSSSWSAPGFHAFDLIAAARYEHYSDAGNSLVPKFGFRWQPVDNQVTLRGSFSRSYTAPTLYALYGPTDTRLVGSGVIQSVFGLPGLQFNGEDGNNPRLKPSTAVTRSMGITFAPQAVPGLTASLDYSSVDQHGYPGGIGFTNILQSVNQLGAASPFSANLALGNFPGQPGATAFTAPGQVDAYLRSGGNPLNLYAIDRFTNLGGLHVRSANMTVDYYVVTDHAGTFTVSTNGAMFFKYQFQALPGQPFYNYAGFATNNGTGVQGTIPRFSFYTTADWQYGNWDLTLGNHYISSVTDIGPGGLVYAQSTTLKPIPVSSYTTWDLRLGYSVDRSAPNAIIKGWSAALGINNIANRMPPLAPQAFTDNNADVATYSPIGRLIYGTATLKF
ncbi:TonB-dependent receptor plug domain-containing protein [Dyella flagellata]|uniref:TonB-dependent receptor n=1 Tax=Dyella flagellata TaxID=1867833 RepID=A0ABQ5X8M7_9GAMM|nr:TonB-dependent receptor plug domain-containing protein [Dyella flagellata]GLQ87511.1 TonB-dependent receptor [Dyella flagellata]